MKRNIAGWIALGLILLAWVPPGLWDLVDRLRGMKYISDEEVALTFGFWLFVWWPCHVLAGLIVLYNLPWIMRTALSKYLSHHPN
jgi:hypothetical protein